MITSENYKQKLIRFQWLLDMAEMHDVKCYDEEINELADKIELYEAKEFPIEEPEPLALVEFHMERTGMNIPKMSKAIGISDQALRGLLKLDRKVTDKMKDRINNFDFHSLKAL